MIYFAWWRSIRDTSENLFRLFTWTYGVYLTSLSIRAPSEQPQNQNWKCTIKPKRRTWQSKTTRAIFLFKMKPKSLSGIRWYAWNISSVSFFSAETQHLHFGVSICAMRPLWLCCSVNSQIFSKIASPISWSYLNSYLKAMRYFRMEMLAVVEHWYRCSLIPLSDEEATCRILAPTIL